MLNLALAGPRCAGKRAIADLLIELLGYRRYGLEDLARAELAIDSNVSVSTIAENPAVYIDALDALYLRRRALDPLFWCNRLGKIIDMYHYAKRPLVVDDVRYMDEARCLTDRGFFLVAVQVPDGIRAIRYAERYQRFMPVAVNAADLPQGDVEAQHIRGVININGLQPPAVSVSRILNWFILEQLHGTA